ncbi:nucleoside hydrolase [Umezawaea sp. Da 62-37]|uniref:nucleoside hydrolase n=1 Tax=Umezawaea sp. Da 62-37 TaxID=3075927 RepID=UPI0037DD01B9
MADTDRWADDALALLFLAARPNVELIAVRSAYDNVSSPVAAENALRLLDVCGLDPVPVAVVPTRR